MVESHSSGCLIFHQLLQLQPLLLHRATRRIKGLHRPQRHRKRRTKKPEGKLWIYGDQWGFNHQKTWEVRNLEISHEILADVFGNFPLASPIFFPGKSLKSLREVPQVHRGRSKNLCCSLIETKNDGAILKKSMCPMGNLPHHTTSSESSEPAATAQCAGTARWDSTAHYLPAHLGPKGKRLVTMSRAAFNMLWKLQHR